MKPIKLTKEAKIKLFELFVDKFNKEFDDYTFKVNDTKINFNFDTSCTSKDKVIILFTQQAYLRMQALVDFYETEVGWYGLVEKISDMLYRVYDVKVCKQYVNGGKVDTKDEDTLEFFNSLTDDEADHMHFQAHSHVRMSTIASGVDLQNQADVVRNMGKGGFYIFQIWNKSGDINTYLYNLDNNIFYDKKDILIEVEDEEGTISDFLASTIGLVEEQKCYKYENNYDKSKSYDKSKQQKKEEHAYLPGYWDGTSYDERWDF